MILQEDRASDRSSALLAYTYKCFVLPSESKLIASISENTETNAILHAMGYTVGADELSRLVCEIYKNKDELLSV